MPPDRGGSDSTESQVSTDELFKQIDTDSSGNISRRELTIAMKLRYGKPLEAKVIDKMLKEADEDGDGEISLPEFRTMMRACEKQKEKSKKLEKTMGLWFSIRERGPMQSREFKASEDMRVRRLANRAKHLIVVEQALEDAAAKNPADFRTPFLGLPYPAPLPPGDGRPPEALSQMSPPGSPKKSPSPRRTPSPRRSPLGFGVSAPHRSAKRRKDVDLEAGMAADAPAEVLDKSLSATLARLWASMPTPGEAAMMVVEFADTYAPLIVGLLIPLSVVVSWINKQLQAYLADPGVVAPPSCSRSSSARSVQIAPSSASTLVATGRCCGGR